MRPRLWLILLGVFILITNIIQSLYAVFYIPEHDMLISYQAFRLISIPFDIILYIIFFALLLSASRKYKLHLFLVKVFIGIIILILSFEFILAFDIYINNSYHHTIVDLTIYLVKIKDLFEITLPLVLAVYLKTKEQIFKPLRIFMLLFFVIGLVEKVLVYNFYSMVHEVENGFQTLTSLQKITNSLGVISIVIACLTIICALLQFVFNKSFDLDQLYQETEENKKAN